MNSAAEPTSDVSVTRLGWAMSLTLLVAVVFIIPFSFLATAIACGVMLVCMVVHRRLGKAWAAIYAASWLVALGGLWPLLGFAVVQS